VLVLRGEAGIGKTALVGPMYRRAVPLALDPLGPIEAFAPAAGPLGLDPLSGHNQA
jgi:hypothetical protein